MSSTTLRDTCWRARATRSGGAGCMRENAAARHGHPACAQRPGQAYPGRQCDRDAANRAASTSAPLDRLRMWTPGGSRPSPRRWTEVAAARSGGPGDAAQVRPNTGCERHPAGRRAMIYEARWHVTADAAAAVSLKATGIAVAAQRFLRRYSPIAPSPPCCTGALRRPRLAGADAWCCCGTHGAMLELLQMSDLVDLRHTAWRRA